MEEARILLDTLQKSIISWDRLREFQIEVMEVSDLEASDQDNCIELLDHNLGALYTKTQGPRWRLHKKEEMLEEGLVYLLIKDLELGKLLGFLSFKIVQDDDMDLHLLYLYEIQFTEVLRNKGLGTFFLCKLEEIVKKINGSGKIKKLWYKRDSEYYDGLDDPELELTGIGLTVFGENENARRLYERLGFALHSTSPQPKKLRNGKIVYPEYMTLEKKIH